MRKRTLTVPQVRQAAKHVRIAARKWSNDTLDAIHAHQDEIEELQNEIEAADQAGYIGMLAERGATFKAAYRYFRADDEVQVLVESAAPQLVRMFCERFPQLRDNRGER